MGFSKDEKKFAQSFLKSKNLYAYLIDGDIGRRTNAATDELIRISTISQIQKFSVPVKKLIQARLKVSVDGIVGTNTKQAINRSKGIIAPIVKAQSLTTSIGTKRVNTSLINPVFKKLVKSAYTKKYGRNAKAQMDILFEETVKLSKKFNWNPNHLLTIFAMETNNTYSPTIRNKYYSRKAKRWKHGSHKGLIQLSTRHQSVSDDLKKQFATIEKYFNQYKSKIKGQPLDKIYLSIAAPKALYISKNQAVYTGKKAKANNKWRIKTSKGYIVTPNSISKAIYKESRKILGRKYMAGISESMNYERFSTSIASSKTSMMHRNLA